MFEHDHTPLSTALIGYLTLKYKKDGYASGFNYYGYDSKDREMMFASSPSESARSKYTLVTVRDACLHLGILTLPKEDNKFMISQICEMIARGYSEDKAFDLVTRLLNKLNQ